MRQACFDSFIDFSCCAANYASNSNYNGAANFLSAILTRKSVNYTPSAEAGDDQLLWRAQIFQIFIHLNRFDGIIEICCYRCARRASSSRRSLSPLSILEYLCTICINSLPDESLLKASPKLCRLLITIINMAQCKMMKVLTNLTHSLQGRAIELSPVFVLCLQLPQFGSFATTATFVLSNKFWII